MIDLMNLVTGTDACLTSIKNMNSSNEMANGTQGSPPECSPQRQSAAEEWIKTIVYLLILCLALFGNAMVIWIIHRHRRMQTATNYLIVNMAVSSMKR